MAKSTLFSSEAVIGARDDDEEIQLLAIETALGLSDADMTAAREKALNAL